MTTLNTGTSWSPRLAIYGDMGSTNARSLPRLINEATAGSFDAILHIGKLPEHLSELFIYLLLLYNTTYIYSTALNIILYSFHILLQVILPMILQQ